MVTCIETISLTNLSVTPLVHCSPFLMYRAKSPLQEILRAISQHSVFTQEYYCNEDITETPLFATGRKELHEILWTVTWLWEERKDFILMTRCFCSTALIQEKKTHKPTVISIQICKGVKDVLLSKGLETKPEFTLRHLWVQSSCLCVQPALAVCSGTSSCEYQTPVSRNTFCCQRFPCHQHNYLTRCQSTQVCHLNTQLGSVPLPCSPAGSAEPLGSTVKLIWRSGEETWLLRR